MMRRGLAALILLAGCTGHRRAPPEAIFEDARQELRKGNLDKAAAQADLGFRQWGEKAGSRWHWEFRLLQAEILLSRGKVQEALRLVDAKLPDQPDFLELAARQRMHQGRAAYRLAVYPKAKTLLDEALQLASKVDSPLLTAEIEMRRGSTLVRLGDFASGDLCYRKALEIGLRQGDLHLQAASLGNLGFGLMNHSRYDEAIPLLERALDASVKAGDASFTARTFGNLGWCYYGLGNLDQALKLLSQAEAEAARGGFRDRHIWLGNIGSVYYSQRDFKNAIAYYQRALSLARNLGESFTVVQKLNDLAQVLMDAGDLAAAESHNREALALGEATENPNSRIWSLLNAARIAAAKRQFEQAEGFYSDVTRLALKLEDPVAQWEAQAGIANLFVANQQWAKAEPQFRAAVSTIERSRSKLARDEWKMTFLAHLIRFYQDYVDFLMERQETEKALQVAESSRARVLAEKLGGELESRPAATLSQLREQARSLNAVLLSYWVAPRRSFLWVISSGGVASFVLPDETALRTWVEAYRDAILSSRDPLGTANPSGLQLYQALVGPAKKLLPAGSRVILVPDGCLHELSFETLPVSTSEPRYWIEDVTVAIAPSLRLLSSRNGYARVPKRSLLLIGDPLSPSPEFPALPDAEREIESIQGRFQASERAVYSKASARPAVYREANPARFSMIHFAAHATANRESPLDSAVILSREADSYKLYAREVMRVPLRAELVTISACRGAGARSYSGEGLVGFAWAFLQAGAHNVIAGLWDVSDRSTSELMANLYAEMAKGLGPAEALRAAKLGLLRSSGPYRKPYYWAPFQLLTRSTPFQKRFPRAATGN